MDKIVAALPGNELDSYITRVGTHGQYDPGENENWAMVGVYLTPFARRERNADEIVEALRLETSRLDGFSNFSYVIESGGPPIGRPITLRVLGSDDGQRVALTSLVVSLLSGIVVVQDLERYDEPAKDQYTEILAFIRPDKNAYNGSEHEIYIIGA